MSKLNSFGMLDRILAVSLVLLTVSMVGLIVIDNRSIAMPEFLSEVPFMAPDDNGVYLVPLNTASTEALQEISGIGPVLASAIIAYREENGRFSALEELLNVKGIGEATLEKIKPYLTID